MKVTGIGGILFRAKDPKVRSAWYAKHLGTNDLNVNYKPWIEQQGPTVFAAFPENTNYFKEAQQYVLNFRVKEIEEQPGVGYFASIQDPEGNRVELW